MMGNRTIGLIFIELLEVHGYGLGDIGRKAFAQRLSAVGLA
jgi:hypothetical protein